MGHGRRRRSGASSLYSGKGRVRGLAIGVAGVLAASVLLLGAVHQHIALGLCAVIGLGSLFFRSELAAGWSPISSLCAALAGWTAVQALPLPLSLVSALSPEAGALYQNTYALFEGASGHWASLSLDQEASLFEAARWMAYACWTALVGYLTRRRGLNLALMIVFGAAVLLAVVTIIQAATGAEKVLGIYEPIQAAPDRVRSVLLNPNNLSGFANLGTFCGLGLLLSRRETLPRALLGAGVAMCLATTVLSASRGGVAFLVAGLLGLLALVLTAARKSQRGRADGALRAFWTLAPLLTVIGVGVALSFLGGTTGTWQELFADDVSKLDEVPQMVPVLSEYWLTGMGRGAFESASQLYDFQGGHHVRQHIENFAMSWLVGWGVPAGGAAILLLLWLLGPRRLRTGGRRPAEAAWAAVMVLLAQNLVDLGLEVFSVTLGLFTLVAGLEGSREERGLPEKKAESTSKPWLGVLVPALALGMVGLGFSGGANVYASRLEVTEELHQLLESPSARYPKLAARLQQEMLSRPAEAHYPLTGSMAALIAGQDAWRWALAGVSRAPKSSRAHFLLAEAAAQRKNLSQALFELKEAASLEPGLAGRAAQRATSWTKDVQLLASALPEGVDGARYLLALRAYLSVEESPWSREELLKKAEARAPAEAQVLEARGFDGLYVLQKKAAPCRKDGAEAMCPLADTKKVEASVERVAAQLEQSPACTPLRLRAALQAHREDFESATRVLSECASCPVALPCLRERVVYAQKLKDFETRREIEQNYVAMSCTTNESCAASEQWIGALALGRGDSLGAHAHFARAAARAPTSERWMLAARAASQAGQLIQAEMALKNAKALGGSDPSVESALREARQAATKKLLE